MAFASLVKSAANILGMTKRTERRFDRHSVCIPASLRLEGRSYDLVGVAIELSRGGALFREASDFILDRNGFIGELKFPGFSVPVTIVASRSSGYGVRFAIELSVATIDDLVAEYGMSVNSLSAESQI